ncbi:MAG: NTP transferase domain-containing protein [Deltaproteobacteria bacterium]|nr:NTP transferase domain-containing protein [Deltaproteobacteria bacterium]MBI4373502.1 NTP transferase domain-containing protein [Deltaproteobacteria bacterium]
MKAVILAAGCGRRLGTASRQLPKAVVPLLGDPLLFRILDLCDLKLFDEVIVVGGYGYHLVEAALGHRGRACRLLHNRQFRKGSVLTLMTALPYLDNSFLIANVDHIYPRRLFRKFLERGEGVTAACDFDRPLVSDDMKIRIDKAARMTAIGKKMMTYDGGYIGMTTVSKDYLETYKRAVRATISGRGESANVEQILETLIGWGEFPRIFDASGLGPWWEVDTQAELMKAETEIPKAREGSFS